MKYRSVLGLMCACFFLNAFASAGQLFSPWMLVRATVWAQLRLPPSLVHIGPPTCEVISGDVGNEVETATSIPVVASTNAITYVRLVTAGRRLLLRSANLPKARTGIVVNVYSKTSRQSAELESVCRNVSLSISDSSPKYLQATNPRGTNGDVWRIEFVVTQDVNASTVADTIEILRDAGSGVDNDWQRQPGEWNYISGLLCVEPVSSPYIVRRASGFAGLVKMQLSIDDTEDLSNRQHASLVESVLRAIGVWVQGCGTCRLEQLAVVDVDGMHFVRSGLAHWLSEQNAGADTSPEQREADLVRDLEPVISLNSPWTTWKELSAYEPVPDIGGICNHGARTPTVETISRALCSNALDGSSPAVPTAVIRVALRRGRTACGDDANIIACRADAELTEFNIRDYRFSFDLEGSAPPVGNGAIEISFVQALVHEIGHWLGLPHIEEGQSIMNASLDTARCIDEATVSALANSDGPRQFSFGGPSAFTLRKQLLAPQKQKR